MRHKHKTPTNAELSALYQSQLAQALANSTKKKTKYTVVILSKQGIPIEWTYENKDDATKQAKKHKTKVLTQTTAQRSNDDATDPGPTANVRGGARQ